MNGPNDNPKDPKDPKGKEDEISVLNLETGEEVAEMPSVNLDDRSSIVIDSHSLLAKSGGGGGYSSSSACSS
jgi:hypothetical protein